MTKNVFISSTSLDLQEHRAAVNAAINQLGMHPLDQKDFGSKPGDATDVSLDFVAKADYFVGIIAHRYGYVPEDSDKSVTEQEYDEAVRLKIPQLMYLIDPQYSWPDSKIEKDTLAQTRLKTFKARIEKELVRSLFTSPDQLAQKVAADLASLELNTRKRQRRLTALWVALVAIALIVALVITNLNWLRRLGVLPPEKIPAGFNVVVAGIGVQQPDGTVLKTSEGDSISNIIYGQVRQFPNIDHTLGPDDIGVSAILGSTPEERRTQAIMIADTLGADVVIYGVAEEAQDGFSIIFQPAFYISVDYAQLQPEFAGASNLGPSIQILKGEHSSEALMKRVAAIQAFLDGLAQFFRAEYAQAQASFDKAVQLSPETEAIYIFAGNAADRNGDEKAALEYYTGSLHNRPTYARGLLGRGSALLGLADRTFQQTHTPYDSTLHLPLGTTCNQAMPLPQAVELLLELAETCYREAESSSDKQEAADLDIKIPFEFARLYYWRSQFGFGDYWDEMPSYLQQVIDLYNASTSDRQARTRVQAGLANGYLGDWLIHSDGTNPESVESAIGYYQTAIMLFEQDVNRDFAQGRIERYQTVIATLQSPSTGP